MNKLHLALLACVIGFYQTSHAARYHQGCDDPAYHQYIEHRFTQFEERNRRYLTQSFKDYELSLSMRNPYRVIANLSRHLLYSAQFDPVSDVEAKISRIFEHSDELTVSQKIAGDVLDGFSNETHSVGIARAWIAYRQGSNEQAFDELLQSIDISDSPLLSSFGPDFTFVRRIYHDGHIEPVIRYINKTETFWTGQRPDELRRVWRAMIKAGCKIQFDSVDKIKAEDLGLDVDKSDR